MSWKQRSAWIGVAAIILVAIFYFHSVGEDAREVAMPTQSPSNPVQATPPQPAPAQSDSAPAKAKDSRYADMSLEDLKLDKNKLIGKRVRVSGLYSSMGDQSMLASEQMDMNPIWLSTSELPRDQRKALQDCPDRSCTFQVEGLIRRMMFGIGIVAESAEEQ